MILVLGKCRHNYIEAARLYHKRFPDHRHLSDVVIQNCELRVRQDIYIDISIDSSHKIQIVTFGAVAINFHIPSQT